MSDSEPLAALLPREVPEAESAEPGASAGGAFGETLRDWAEIEGEIEQLAHEIITSSRHRCRKCCPASHPHLRPPTSTSHLRPHLLPLPPPSSLLPPPSSLPVLPPPPPPPSYSPYSLSTHDSSSPPPTHPTHPVKVPLGPARLPLSPRGRHPPDIAVSNPNPNNLHPNLHPNQAATSLDITAALCAARLPPRGPERALGALPPRSCRRVGPPWAPPDQPPRAGPPRSAPCSEARARPPT